MPSIAELAIEEARDKHLDLSTRKMMVPVNAFKFHLLEPSKSVMAAFHQAKVQGLSWPKGVPLPVLTYHPADRTFGVMDGMMRIRAAQLMKMPQFPALVASGDTYDALQPILSRGYHGDDFVEMLCLVSPEVRKNQESCNRNRLAGL